MVDAGGVCKCRGGRSIGGGAGGPAAWPGSSHVAMGDVRWSEVQLGLRVVVAAVDRGACSGGTRARGQLLPCTECLAASAAAARPWFERAV